MDEDIATTALDYVNPREDMEARTRPSYQKNRINWQPVYIKLRGDTGLRRSISARILIFLAASGLVAYDKSTALRLARVEKAQNAPQHLLFMFIYVPEGFAKLYATAYAIRHVGVAVPYAFVNAFRNLSSSETPKTEYNQPDRGVVATAVIDDAVGVLNARFRESEGKTRISRYWLQAVESVAYNPSLPNVTIGREFTDTDINDFISSSGGFEDEGYRQLVAASRLDADGGLAAFEAHLGRVKEHLREVGISSRIHIEYAVNFFKHLDSIANRPEVKRILSEYFDYDELFKVVSANIRSANNESVLAAISECIDKILALIKCPGFQSLLRKHFKFAGADVYAEPFYRRPVVFRGTHGTHVLDLAAGAEVGEKTLAKEPIFVVEVPPLATAETTGGRLDTFILQAVLRILDWADNWDTPNGPRRIPVVINLSYGVTAGPKDGTGFLEREIARHVEARNDDVATKVVFSAGNSYRGQLTGGLELSARGAGGDQGQFTWRVIPQDLSVSFLEFQLPRAAKCEFEITPPEDETHLTIEVEDGKLKQGVAEKWEGKDCKRLIGAYYRQRSPRKADMIEFVVALCPTQNNDKPQNQAPPGAYEVKVSNLGASKIHVNFDVQRDDTPSSYPQLGRQSYLEDPRVNDFDPETGSYTLPSSSSAVQREGTLSAYATNPSDHMLVAAGCYYKPKDERDYVPTLYTPAGPARTGHIPGPDLTTMTEHGRYTPGMLAGGTLSGSTSVFSGTSAAAPQVTRALVALLLSDPGAGALDRAQLVVRLLNSGRPLPVDLRLGRGVLVNTASPPGRRGIMRRFP